MGQRNAVIQCIRQILRNDARLTDGKLLEEYISRHDERALEILVERHAPMVWGVCRRILFNHHAAEDAFQATFLVLVRKAGSITSPELLANWLYGVAYQTSLKARATIAKRRERESQVIELPEPISTPKVEWLSLQAALDEELSRLPDHYRSVIVLCDLEGQTRKQVAGQLGCAEGTVASRLARARILLAKQLSKRGIALSGGALATVLAQNVLSASVPNLLLVSTIKSATIFVTGTEVATGVISGKVVAIAEGVLKAMFLTKLKTAAIALVLILGFGATGVTFLASRTVAGQDVSKRAAEFPMRPAAKQEQEPFTAWGKEVEGVQLGIRLGNQRVYQVGESVTLILRLRNNSKETVRFRDNAEYFYKNPPHVTDSEGKARSIQGFSIFGFIRKKSLAPGKEVDLIQLELAVRPETDREQNSAWTLYGTGKFQIQYKVEDVVGDVRVGGPGMTLSTGKLELEVKQPQKPTPDKEAFTAWGKEAGGLQAGLGLPPGAKRVYQQGEIVTLFVRVRNVSKETLKFDYIPQFLDEQRPIMTDSNGKAIPQFGTSMLGIHGTTTITLEPGKEAVLQTRMSAAAGMRYELIPVGEGAKAGTKEKFLLVGTGKVNLQYERVIGNSSSGFLNNVDSVFGKLGTGKLELEVQAVAKEKTKCLTPEDAIRAASDPTRMKEFNKSQPPVEFQVESVTRTNEKLFNQARDEAVFEKGRGLEDVGLRSKAPIDGIMQRFGAVLTAKAVRQFNRAGIQNIEKHFEGKTIRVTGSISKHDDNIYGHLVEYEIVIDDLNQLEVVK
ncbi:sigma-70 family RNA polymerase sigma factor [Telmatocola sphagniphila]|uniref:Sigma-70 family RNA polymerase sigma factor n=1 Tax=Telmatocola sphagniphila TaxID=1123043 RepID=A0A8E6BA97_9BACT|nr:sigma-70 family RNA polymerase sigma factor [Telmatocola sphagniphila]QVL34026.1 sigma-70 family RNA polymerase sigma factor [Telmatocola sphagniphila]